MNTVMLNFTGSFLQTVITYFYLVIFGGVCGERFVIADAVVEKEEIMSDNNFTLLVEEVKITSSEDEKYDQLLADMWVGVVLTLMVLSCVCCLCSCLLYHKFQQWKQRVLESRAQAARNAEGGDCDIESLPSYTIVSGLPSYEQAMEQLKQVKEECSKDNSIPEKCQEVKNSNSSPPQQTQFSRLSVFEFFRSNKNSNS